MTFAKHTSDRRSRAQVRRLRRAEPYPIQDLRRSRADALVLSPRQHARRVRLGARAWSSLMTKAATTLCYCAGHALPALLLGFFSWAVAEILAGFAAYAEAMYSPPAPKVSVAAGMQPTDTPRGANPSLSLMTMQLNDGSAGCGNQARTGGGNEALPTEWRGKGPTDWHASLTQVAAAWWSSMHQAIERRRAIKELRGLDDRALRDIGMSRCEIEHIVRHGTRGE